MVTNMRLAVMGAAIFGAVSVAATTASAALIDDFGGNSISSAYVATKVLDSNTATQITFNAADGKIHSSYSSTGTGAAEQTLLLRDDVAGGLAVGQNLIADVAGFATAGAFDRDIGIAVGYTKSPAGLADGAGGDVRTSYVEVSIRGNNQVVSFARNGGANLASGQIFTGQTTPALTTTDPLALYITRTATNVFEVGFVQNSVKRAVQTYTITDANVPGAAVGFYTDLRASLATTPVSLDNLRIDALPVPEPTTLAALAGGAIVAVRRRRR